MVGIAVSLLNLWGFPSLRLVPFCSLTLMAPDSFEWNVMSKLLGTICQLPEVIEMILYLHWRFRIYVKESWITCHWSHTFWEELFQLAVWPLCFVLRKGWIIIWNKHALNGFLLYSSPFFLYWSFFSFSAWSSCLLNFIYSKALCSFLWLW